MNLKTAGVVRKMKDADGNSIWVNGIAQGQPALLLGYPVEIDEEMPDMADGSLSIAFGDIQQAYIIVNRPGVRMLVDPYSAKPNVLFYAYTRVGGQVQNGEAVKLLRFSVSG
jgi:HK97 family phage major capsid protein